jgi:osmotically-inducible protein OsmY
MKTTPLQQQVFLKTKTDEQIKMDVLSELIYEPAIHVTDIGVLVKDGVVTLNGATSSHGEKWHAIRAAKRVGGVKAIADEINIKITTPHQRSDAEIAAAAVHQLEWSTTIPKGAVTVTVREGAMTLEGEVEWWYQKIAAEDVMQYMVGVQGIVNQITIRPLISATDLKSAINAAFNRSAMLDARKIDVETTGSKVTLNGKVANSAEREEAERVAWAAPGVLKVDNRIKLEWGWGMFL